MATATTITSTTKLLMDQLHTGHVQVVPWDYENKDGNKDVFALPSSPMKLLFTRGSLVNADGEAVGKILREAIKKASKANTNFDLVAKRKAAEQKADKELEKRLAYQSALRQSEHASLVLGSTALASHGHKFAKRFALNEQRQKLERKAQIAAARLQQARDEQKRLETDLREIKYEEKEGGGRLEGEPEFKQETLPRAQSSDSNNSVNLLFSAASLASPVGSPRSVPLSAPPAFLPAPSGSPVPSGSPAPGSHEVDASTSTPTETSTSTPDELCFCYEPMGSAYAVSLTCSHKLHLACYEKWRTSQTKANPGRTPTCPYCRAPSDIA